MNTGKFNTLSTDKIPTINELRKKQREMHANLDQIKGQATERRSTDENANFIKSARQALKPILTIAQQLQDSTFKEDVRAEDGIKAQTANAVNEWMKRIHEMRAIEVVGLPVAANSKVRERPIPQIDSLRDVAYMKAVQKDENSSRKTSSYVMVSPNFLGNKAAATIAKSQQSMTNAQNHKRRAIEMGSLAPS